MAKIPSQAGESYPLLQRLPKQSVACVCAMGLTLPSPPPPPPAQPAQPLPQKEAPFSAPPVYGYGTVRGGSYGPLPGDPGTEAGLPSQWVLAALQSQALGQGAAYYESDPGVHPAPEADAARADGAPAPARFAAEAGFAAGAPQHGGQPAAPAHNGEPAAMAVPNGAACAAGPTAACGSGCQESEHVVHTGAAGLANGSAAHHATDGM